MAVTSCGLILDTFVELSAHNWKAQVVNSMADFNRWVVYLLEVSVSDA